LSSTPTWDVPTYPKLAFDSPSVETPSTENISLTEPSHRTKKKRTKEKGSCPNDLAIPSDGLSGLDSKEAKQRAKIDKKARKEKKRSQADNESC
jgi:hypothetical protein